ncbi:MAG: SCO family protein [Myxococcota bacterium]
MSRRSLSFAAALALTATARAEEPMSEHCARAAAAEKSPFTRTEAGYDVPHVRLLDQRGQPVDVAALASGEQPVALNFIFATCTTICPVMTATFAQMRSALGPDADRVRMVSVSIDPEHDTPAVLAAYAEKFDAPAAWSFLTGDAADVQQVLRAFDADFGSKFNHRPLTLLHAAGAEEWVRLDGLGSGAALADEVRGVLR